MTAHEEATEQAKELTVSMNPCDSFWWPMAPRWDYILSDSYVRLNWISEGSGNLVYYPDTPDPWSLRYPKGPRFRCKTYAAAVERCKRYYSADPSHPVHSLVCGKPTSLWDTLRSCELS